MNGNKKIWLFILATLFGCNLISAQYQDRFVWIFGWGFNKDSDVAEIKEVLKTASVKMALMGAMMSAGHGHIVQTKCRLFQTINEILQFCKENNLNLFQLCFQWDMVEAH
jgi:UDP-N-acetylmuramoylalanine-D-glutamate ligase